MTADGDAASAPARDTGPGDEAAFDAVVVGRTLPALIAALDLAEVGLSVLVTAGPEDLPEGPVRDPEGVLASAITRIAEPIEGTGGASDPRLLPETTVPSPSLLLDREGHWAPQSTPSVLGIPAMPLSAECLRLLGTGPALRAYLDRLIPLLTIGKTKTMGELIRRRLGPVALERLSEPLLRERFGLPATEVDVALAAPGLNETLSRTGSLTGAALAYADRNVARETAAMPAGGWPLLHTALLRRLSAYAVELSEAGARELSAEEGATWAMRLSDGRRIISRSLVLDPGAELAEPHAQEALWAPVPSLRPPRARVHADIDIQGFPGVDAPADAVRVSGDRTLRLTPREAGSAAARVSEIVAAEAQAVEAAEILTGHRGPEEMARLRADIEAVLAEAGLTPAADAEWRVHCRAAPHATLEQRERSEAALDEQLGHQPALLPVGVVFHGDELPAAIAAAQRQAVALRRRLLGLSEPG